MVNGLMMVSFSLFNLYMMEIEQNLNFMFIQRGKKMKWLEKYLSMQVPYWIMGELNCHAKDEAIENFIKLNNLAIYEIKDVINIIKKYDYDKDLNFIKEEDIQIGKKFKSEFTNNVCEIVNIVNDKLIVKFENNLAVIKKDIFRKYLLKEVRQ